MTCRMNVGARVDSTVTHQDPEDPASRAGQLIGNDSVRSPLGSRPSRSLDSRQVCCVRGSPVDEEAPGDGAISCSGCRITPGRRLRHTCHRTSPGRRNRRRPISGIVFVIRNGLRWRDAPAACGPHKTICNRLATPPFHTRHDRCAHAFFPAICIAATVIFWLRQCALGGVRICASAQRIIPKVQQPKLGLLRRLSAKVKRASMFKLSNDRVS